MKKKTKKCKLCGKKCNCPTKILILISGLAFLAVATALIYAVQSSLKKPLGNRQIDISKIGTGLIANPKEPDLSHHIFIESEDKKTVTYENKQYGFSFDYPNEQLETKNCSISNNYNSDYAIYFGNEKMACLQPYYNTDVRIKTYILDREPDIDTTNRLSGNIKKTKVLTNEINGYNFTTLERHYKLSYDEGFYKGKNPIRKELVSYIAMGDKYLYFTYTEIYNVDDVDPSRGYEVQDSYLDMYESIINSFTIY